MHASDVEIRHDQSDGAFCPPATVRIHLPTRDSFQGAGTYYATELHELDHASGHPSRLDRNLAYPFGSVGYAKEKLRAEPVSLMIGDQLGIGHDSGQHAAEERWPGSASGALLGYGVVFPPEVSGYGRRVLSTGLSVTGDRCISRRFRFGTTAVSPTRRSLLGRA